MAEADILERLDTHLAHSGGVLERIEQEMRLTRELHAETRAFNESILADFRQFVRDIVARMERLGRDEATEIRRLAEEQRASREEQRAFREEQRAFREEQQDLRAESRAQTQALLRMIERLGPGDAAA
ncbi:MAG: hypothetical protein ACR2LH_06645 [Thermoleophilaceae bacterium]